ncbi:pollen-specific protein C13-like [Cucurbita maxima]|uniref:Pollen-specific protein C13-like n=1 Tax=Cucurbita maxima TaxID=3661 RepID=A0A6J1KHX3_CUCMA|nr:pollen-specific protein C13-like [Cucurbita maxima]
MARFVVLFALCVLPALIAATRPVRTPFVVRGKVYCDTCLAGFETSATTYIPGAKVKIECKNRNTMELLYSQEATTDSTGSYSLLVNEDHEDQVCDALLISSPEKECSAVSEGRDRARVILTRYNGIASNDRYVNAMGFARNEALSGCNQVLSQYQDIED